MYAAERDEWQIQMSACEERASAAVAAQAGMQSDVHQVNTIHVSECTEDVLRNDYICINYWYAYTCSLRSSCWITSSCVRRRIG